MARVFCVGFSSLDTVASHGWVIFEPVPKRIMSRKKGSVVLGLPARFHALTGSKRPLPRMVPALGNFLRWYQFLFHAFLTFEGAFSMSMTQTLAPHLPY